MKKPYNFECWNCETENGLSEAVVELCREHWTHCKDCGERNKLILINEP
jgi:transcription elongation factor Elf1